MKPYYEIDTSPSMGLIRIAETKSKALIEKRTMQKSGLTNVQIKKKYRRSLLSDYR